MASNWDLCRCLEAWTEAGLQGISVGLPHFERSGVALSIRELKASGLTVCNFEGLNLYELIDPPLYVEKQKQALAQLNIAAEVGAQCCSAGIMPRRDLAWDEAARHIVEQTVAFLPELHARNMRLVIEPVSPIRQDVSFVNLAADALEIVSQVDDPSFGFLFDTYHLWWQRGIEDLSRQNASKVFHVQVSDQKAITLRTRDRVMPGEGIIPLHRLLHSLADGGYSGWWELEVISDGTDDRGIESALRTAARAINDVWGP